MKRINWRLSLSTDGLFYDLIFYFVTEPFFFHIFLTLWGVWCCSDAYAVGWNGRMGMRHSRLTSPGAFLDKDGIFINTTNSKLLERAHGILMSVYKEGIVALFLEHKEQYG